MTLANLIPWSGYAALIPLLGLIGKLWLDNRKLKMAEKDSDQRLREAGQRLLLEAADKLSHAPEHAHDRAQCIVLLASWVRAQTGQEWDLVERDTVSFLKRMGAEEMIAGVLLMSDREGQE